MKTWSSPIGSIITIATLLSPTFRADAQDPLNAWGTIPVSGLTASMASVEYGNGVFVAVGANSTVARSTDGLNWTVATAGSYGNLSRVRFINGEFIALGSTDKIIFSSDGTSWGERTLPTAGSWDIAHGNGVYVVLGNTTYVSSDAVSWTATFPKGWRALQLRTVPLDTIIFANGTFIGLPVGTQGETKQTALSTNGVDWTLGAAGTPAAVFAGGSTDLVQGPNVVLGTSIDLANVGVWGTTNGNNWCCHAWGGAGPGDIPVALTYGAGYFLYVVRQNFGATPSNWYFTSADGVDWVTRTNMSGPTLRSAAFGAGMFIGVGDSGLVVHSGNLSGAPVIISEPADRAAVAGNPASFNVNVAGADPLSYQWYFGGTAISGATTASYNISQVAPGNMGNYQVVITNSIGSVTSRVAQLTVAFLNIKCYAGIDVLGSVGKTYRIEATDATGAPNWQTVTNFVLPQTPYTWIDYDSANVPARLYRALELP